ncbi:hypothetical protein JW711_06560 [Candidatus Woesearchaeota archaeon]|nr:hypothetical protein [Candidatus Woesearchaeota archaeon]
MEKGMQKHHHQKRIKRLHAKGWSMDEIAQVDIALNRAERKKHPHVRHVETGMFWFTLCTGVLGSLILSFALIPILVAASNMWTYGITFLFGLLLGILIIYIVKRMHWLSSHQVSVSFIVPLVAVFNFFIIIFHVNGLSELSGFTARQDPVLIGTLYFIGFLLPYAFFLAFRRWK